MLLFWKKKKANTERSVKVMRDGALVLTRLKNNMFINSDVIVVIHHFMRVKDGSFRIPSMCSSPYLDDVYECLCTSPVHHMALH